MHGFALNVNTDLKYFDMIIGCEGEPVTSMEQIRGDQVDLAEVEDRVIQHFLEVFSMELDPVSSCEHMLV